MSRRVSLRARFRVQMAGFVALSLIASSWSASAAAAGTRLSRRSASAAQDAATPQKASREDQAKAERLRKDSSLRTPATVDNGPGDGTVAIAVDGYGAFGSSVVGSPAAVYDPVGPNGPASTVFDSALYFSPLDDYLAEQSVGNSTGSLPSVNQTVISDQHLQSTFTVAGFNFLLDQTLSNATAQGSIFTQTYSVANNTGAPQTFKIVRYFDGDLLFDGTLIDGGRASADGTVLSEFDAVGTNSVKSVISISATGGTQTAFSLQPYSGGTTADRIRTDNGIGPAIANQISGDSNGDRVTDTNYDVTLLLEHQFTVPVGGAVTYSTITEFSDRAVFTADVSLAKTAFPDPPAQDDIVTYTLAVTNAGPDTAVGVAVTDTLPTGTTFVSAQSPGSCETPPVGSTGTVTCNIGDVVAGQTVNVTIDVLVTVAPGTELTNAASAESLGSLDPNSGNNTMVTHTATVVAAMPDVRITKTDSPDPVAQDSLLVYTINVANAGPGTARDVVFADSVPAGTTFAFLFTSQGSCAALPPGGTGTVTCDLGSIRGGESVEITFGVNVVANAGTVLSNTATVSTSSPDPNLTNNTATELTNVDLGVGRVDLGLTMTAAPDPVAVGGRITYRITLTNAGPDAATNAAVYFETPMGTRYVSATLSQGGFTPLIGDVGTFVWSLGTLPAGATATASIVLDVLNPEGSRITAFATSTSLNRDVNPPNNRTTVSTLIAGRGGDEGTADVGFSAVATPEMPQSGGEVTYTLTITNAGPDPAAAVALTSATPAGTSFASISSSQGACTTPASGSTGPINCQLGGLDVGATATVTVVLNVVAAGGATVDFTATVSTASADLNTSNNTVSLSNTVRTGAPVSISSVTRLTRPFRIKITGSGFQPGALVYIGGSQAPWPITLFKSSTMLVVKRGGRLKAEFPKGTPTEIRVVNPDGGEVEATFTR